MVVAVLCSREKQQEKMANYCKTIFGDSLLTDTLEKYPVSSRVATGIKSGPCGFHPCPTYMWFSIP